MKKVIFGLVISMFATTSAFAWGEREQGILAGVAGLWVYQQLNKQGQPSQPPVIVQQPPVVVQSHPPVVMNQPQQYCESTQVQDQFGRHRLITYCYYK